MAKKMKRSCSDVSPRKKMASGMAAKPKKKKMAKKKMSKKMKY